MVIINLTVLLVSILVIGVLYEIYLRVNGGFIFNSEAVGEKIYTESRELTWEHIPNTEHEGIIINEFGH